MEAQLSKAIRKTQPELKVTLPLQLQSNRKGSVTKLWAM